MLWKKMLRDLRDNKGSYLAAIVVIIIGLMVFTAFSMVLDNLQQSKQEFYYNQNFADGFAQVEALPASEVNRLLDIQGIASIQGRIVKDVRMLHPDRNENIYLRLVTMDYSQEGLINDVHLTQGMPLSDREPQVWVDSKFYEANRLNLNDKLQVIAGGKKRSLQVIGVGDSPEFVYALRTSADIYPTPETFGIAFISLEVMKSLFPQENAFNDLVFTLEPGADFEEVKHELEYQLNSYGLRNLIPRDDHVSHFMLTAELEELESMATAFPAIFLSIAAMVLYITIKRMIEQQRGQIGILKAFGYTHREIIWHYLSYALIIGLIGGVAGGALGILSSGPFTTLYQVFFSMPDMEGNIQPHYFMISILLSTMFSLFAGYQGCKKIIALEPAEAMRPPAPIIGGKVLLEKISLFWNMLTVQGMMSIRNLSRNKGRTAFIFVGIMFCFAISAFTWSMNDMMDKLLFDQYEKVEVYDVKITLAHPNSEKNVTRELQAFPGVSQVEALAEVPVTLNNQWHQKDVLLLGVPANSDMYNILDRNDRPVPPPKNGLLLSERLAQLLDADIGTRLSVESVMLKSWVEGKELEVVGVIPQYVGINAYMELESLQSFLGQKDLATSIMLNIDAEKTALLQKEYLLSDAIAGIDEQAQRLNMLQDLMASYGSMVYIFAIIGMIIGFAIIYSTTIITLSERERELSSMMVLGMTPREVLSVVTFEQWFIGFLAMLFGIPMSKIMIMGFSEGLSNDMFTIPTDLTPSAFLMAFAVTGFSIWFAQQIAARKVRQLNLVDVLKERE